MWWNASAFPTAPPGGVNGCAAGAAQRSCSWSPPATTAARCRRPSKTCSGVCGWGSKPCHGAASPGKGDPSSPGVAHGLPPPPRLGGVAGFRPAPDHMPGQATGPGHGAELGIAPGRLGRGRAPTPATVVCVATAWACNGLKILHHLFSTTALQRCLLQECVAVRRDSDETRGLRLSFTAPSFSYTARIPKSCTGARTGAR